MSVEVTIVCDQCGNVFAGGRTAAEARASVKESARVGLPGGRDLCWECTGGQGAHVHGPVMPTGSVTRRP